MTVGALMGFPTTSSGVVSATGTAFLADSRFGFCYQVASGTAADSGLRKWDLWPNGIELRARNRADLGISALSFVSCSTYNSQLLIVNESLSNSSRLLYFRRSDLSLVGTFGVDSSSLSASSALRILQPTKLCPIVDQYGNDQVLTVSFFRKNEINCVNVGQHINANLGNVDEANALLGSLPDGSAVRGYILGYPDVPGSFITDPCGIYSVTAAGGFVKLGVINPTDVDAAWTSGWTTFSGITIDQTDGNLIVAFTTLQVVTNKAYLVKLNSTTGAVMWRCAMPDGINYNGQDMMQHVVRNGRLYHLSSSTFKLATINTTAGTQVTTTLSQATLDGVHQAQMSEDVTDSITWWGAWNEVASHPAYLGNYCLVQGNHSGSSMGWRYFVNGAPVPAPSYGIPSTSRKRAWTFTMDGHPFYVLDLGIQGTLLYDQLTDQWSVFVTSGYNQWNVANGCQWGQRIVGGDLYTTELWEMQPGALKDNGTLDIVHIVTGGLVKRNRTFVSVDALRLAISNGQLDALTGAYVTLAFSDDQGKTFTTMPSINLTQADYTTELAWQSLGSFAAPGRVFRITDVGGFLRIDGCDAGINDFDEDEQTGGQ